MRRTPPKELMRFHLEENETKYFRPHQRLIFLLVLSIQTKTSENDGNELDLGLCIQLFRQRLSHKSVKAYGTMPIGTMGSKSLALLY